MTLAVEEEIVNKARFKGLFFILVIATILSGLAAWEALQEKYLEVHFFDVGQGDATFIETPDGRQILIDAGPGRSILNSLDSVLPFYDRSIDLLVLTHPDVDHIGGADELLQNYRIKAAMANGASSDTAAFQKTISGLRKEGASVFIAKTGHRINLGEDLRLDVLSPNSPETLDDNNASLVLRLVYKNDSFLFPADIEKEIEQKLVEENYILKADVLKVAHHGSKSSSSGIFLAAVAPKIAVVSVGRNSYGQPHQEVLARLGNILTLRTDKNGAITLRSNGDSF